MPDFANSMHNWCQKPFHYCGILLSQLKSVLSADFFMVLLSNEHDDRTNRKNGL